MLKHSEDENNNILERTDSMTMLTQAQLDELCGFDTPTVSNAIECFQIRSRIEGFIFKGLVSDKCVDVWVLRNR